MRRCQKAFIVLSFRPKTIPQHSRELLKEKHVKGNVFLSHFALLPTHLGWKGLNIFLTRLIVSFKGKLVNTSHISLIAPKKQCKKWFRHLDKAWIVWEGELDKDKLIRFGQKQNSVHNLVSHQYLVSCQNTIELQRWSGNFCLLTKSLNLYRYEAKGSNLLS